MQTPASSPNMVAPPVYRMFCAFWEEVKKGVSSIHQPALAAAVGSVEPYHAPTAVRSALIRSLEGQAMSAERIGGAQALESYREAQYLMAALADEVFLNLPWAGASHWSDRLLETHFFGTRYAGQCVFDRIESLLDRRDPRDREMAAAYLSALGLGFRGKYLGRDDDGALPRYRTALYHCLSGRAPALSDPTRRLLPQCYEFTLDRRERKQLRSPRVWWWLVAAVVAVWLLASSIAWLTITRELDDHADRIKASPAGAMQ